MIMGRHRATRTEEKEARRQQILAAAGELLQGWSYSDISMERIAERAGIAKGTLYLYFRTKEDLFLQVFEQRLGTWYAELEALARDGAGTVRIPAVARAISSTLTSKPALVRLHGLLHSTILANVDVETTTAFRHRHRRMMSSLVPALAERIESLDETGALRLLVRIEAVVAGLSWAGTQPSAYDSSFSIPDLEVYHLDFEQELMAIIVALLKSAAAGPTGRPAGS
jgi:AcrR family transcriptional regulator